MGTLIVFHGLSVAVSNTMSALDWPKTKLFAHWQGGSPRFPVAGENPITGSARDAFSPRRRGTGPPSSRISRSHSGRALKRRVQRQQYPFDDLVFLLEITQFFSFKVVFGLADFLFNIAKPLLAAPETFDKPFRVGTGERERYLLFHHSLLACCNLLSDLDFSANVARPCLLKFLVKGVAAIPVPAEKSNQQPHG
jgi:hypothetical protein